MRRRLPPVLQQRDFSFFWAALLSGGFAGRMVVVAVGWQVYSINESALDLAWIGLAEFIPLPLLALPAGHIADRFSRKRVMALSFVLDAGVTTLLLGVTISGANELWPFLVLAFVSGVSVALGSPASRALPPTLVSVDLLASAVAYRSIAFQSATIAGPALGGLLFAIQPELLYAVAVGLFAIAVVCLIPMRERLEERVLDVTESGKERLLAGLRLVKRTPVLLGAISLDLVAVLFGGAMALLPLFAKSILDTGPVGLGNPPQRAGRRSPVRRHTPRPKADRRQRGPHAADRRRHLRRREHSSSACRRPSRSRSARSSSRALRTCSA